MSERRVCTALRGTYEKIAPSERNTTFGVPRSAPKEGAGIGQEILLDAPVKNDRIQWSFGTRSNLVPLVHCCRGVNCDMFRLRLLPATLGVRKKLVDDFWAVAEDSTNQISKANGTMLYTEHPLDFQCLKSNVRGTLCPCPRRTQVVTFVPEGGGDKEGWLLPDFEVLGTMTSIAILSVLSGPSGLETESPGCDGEVSSGAPFRLLGQPNVDPG